MALVPSLQVTSLAGTAQHMGKSLLWVSTSMTVAGIHSFLEGFWVFEPFFWDLLWPFILYFSCSSRANQHKFPNISLHPFTFFSKWIWSINDFFYLWLYLILPFSLFFQLLPDHSQVVHNPCWEHPLLKIQLHRLKS